MKSKDLFLYLFEMKLSKVSFEMFNVNKIRIIVNDSSPQNKIFIYMNTNEKFLFFLSYTTLK